MTKNNCAQCGNNEIKTEWADHTFKYGSDETGVDLTVKIPFRHCATCSFIFTDNEAEALMHDAVCRHLGVMTPAEIVKVRQLYGLSRKEFSVLSSIGEASLGRWESGALIQNAANDNYLYLLSISANIDRIKNRPRHNPLNLIVPSDLARIVSKQFRCLSPADIERKAVAAATFKL